MTGSIAGFTALAIAARELQDSLATFEMMLYRSAIGFALVACAVVVMRRRRDIRERHLDLHGLRNVIHFSGQNLWLLALTMSPLAQVFAVEFSYPIMVALTAPFFLGERLTALRIGVALLGFAGILIVARPFGGAGFSPGLLAALASAVCFAGTALVTKRLTRVESIVAILFWLTAFQTVFGLVTSALDGTLTLPAQDDLCWVLVLGVSGIAAHVGLTTALTLAPAAVVTPLDFFRLPVIAVIGTAWYAEPFDPWVLAGGGIVFFANWINIRGESRAPRTTDQNSRA
jgi:drug/metabolite transporter (DMT)-like permease